MKQTIKKYSGALLAGAIILGGVANATFDFTTLPGADKIKSGAVIKADDILALSTALGTLDTRTDGHEPTGDFDLVAKKWMDASDITFLNSAKSDTDTKAETAKIEAVADSKTYIDGVLGDLGGKTVAEYVAENTGLTGTYLIREIGTYTQSELNTLGDSGKEQLCQDTFGLEWHSAWVSDPQYSFINRYVGPENLTPIYDNSQLLTYARCGDASGKGTAWRLYFTGQCGLTVIPFFKAFDKTFNYATGTTACYVKDYGSDSAACNNAASAKRLVVKCSRFLSSN